MFPPSFYIFVFGFSLIYLIKRRWNKGQKNIPGPLGLPLLGNILQFIGDLPHKRLGKWAEKYGEIFQISLGPKATLIISDPTLLKQVFNDPTFAGRPVVDIPQIYEGQRLGLLLNDGPLGEMHRRFALRQLKDLGALPRRMENSVLAQVNKAVILLESEGELVASHKIKNIMSTANSASFWAIICSGHDAFGSIHLIEKFMDTLNVITKCGLLAIACPWLRPICPNLIGYKKYRDVMDEFKEFFETLLHKRKESFDENNIRDFIDAFLVETKKAEPGTPFYGDLAEKHLVQVLWEMYLGTGDSTSAIIEWTILYLCKNNKVQEKFQEEIGTVTGNTRNIVLADKSKMPFALAVSKKFYDMRP